MPTEEWIVRVNDREYGPVDLDTLHEWQSDGRLIPDNDIRPAGATEWKKASAIPNLFPPPLPRAPITTSATPLAPSRSIIDLIAESFRIYRRAFLPFFSLSLLVAFPACGLHLAFSYSDFPKITLNLASGLAIFCGAVLLVVWPIFLAGIQLATAETREGKPPSTRDLFRRATNFWPRVARLSLIVYGSYFLWSVIPVLAIFSLLYGQPSLVSLLLALVILIMQVLMTARLWANFLFWQQSCVLSGQNTIDSLRESKELAHSRACAPLTQRPLFQGAILVSIWILAVLVLSIVVQVPFTMLRMQGESVASIQQMMDLADKLSHAKPDGITLATNIVTSLAQALFRPLLGIVFVLLYFEAKRNHRPRDREL